MSSTRARRMNPPECEDLIAALGDTPETVIAVYQLRHGLCEAHVEAGSGRHDAVILRPSCPSDELTGFGTDADSLCRVLRGLHGWSCVCVGDGIARRLGSLLEAQLGHPARYVMDIYHTLQRPVVAGSHPSVRYLTGADLDLLSTAPPDIRSAWVGSGTFERLFDAGIVAGTVVTAGLWRGRGLATACGGLVAAVIQRSGRVPVWGTGEDNLASLRVARKLGFEEVGRRTFVIAGGNDPG